MQDLNDLYYFASVVEHGGFAAAGRALGLPKSRLSRRIARLEESLGVRLIQRSTRHFQVTDVGRRFHEHCRAMLVEAEGALQVAEQVQAQPRGRLRISCPTTLLHVDVGRVLTRFMSDHPQVTVHLEATNRRVDVLAEGFDVAIRVRAVLEDSELVLRTLSDRNKCLVAAPERVAHHGTPAVPAALEAWPSLVLGPSLEDQEWTFIGREGERVSVRPRPSLLTTDMETLQLAAKQGLGAAVLPRLVVREALRDGSLVELLPDWSLPRDIIHLVYPSRRGVLPAVRALVDHLVCYYESFEED